jgi:hypothetical protein
MSTLGSQEFAGGLVEVGRGGFVGVGSGVVGCNVVVGRGAFVGVGSGVVGRKVVVVGRGAFVGVGALGAGGGIGFGGTGAGATGVGSGNRATGVGSGAGATGVGIGNVAVGRQFGGHAPTPVGGRFVGVVAFGGLGAPPVGPFPAAAFSFHVSWRLSGDTHTPSPSKASRHTNPGLQVSGPNAPPLGSRRLAALAFSCATSAATCLVTHT